MTTKLTLCHTFVAFFSQILRNTAEAYKELLINVKCTQGQCLYFEFLMLQISAALE